MILPISKHPDGRMHAVNVLRTRGRPLDLAKPLDEIRQAIDRRVAHLERKAGSVERDLRRWREVASSFGQ